LEEIDALYEGQHNTIVMSDGGRIFACGHLADILHTEGAETLATYGDDFYAGMPALTKNTFGKGAAYYIASDPQLAFLEVFYGQLIDQYGLDGWDTPNGVEVTKRYKDGKALIFVLNHNAEASTLKLDDNTYTNLLNNQTITKQLELGAYDVAILVTREATS
ncbi:MAG: beta-galactosidase trimerization domain-containing protein, partial [Anaerolineae bacterium]|nr:beta-galactosidase trimerization domain-containing protein [Anaerolineae bacterium]